MDRLRFWFDLVYNTCDKALSSGYRDRDVPEGVAHGAQVRLVVQRDFLMVDTKSGLTAQPVGLPIVDAFVVLGADGAWRAVGCPEMAMMVHAEAQTRFRVVEALRRSWPRLRDKWRRKARARFIELRERNEELEDEVLMLQSLLGRVARGEAEAKKIAEKYRNYKRRKKGRTPPLPHATPRAGKKNKK